jgi:hypothetical protein
VDNNYLDLGMNKSGFVHALPSGRLIWMDSASGQLPSALFIWVWGRMST